VDLQDTPVQLVKPVILDLQDIPVQLVKQVKRVKPDLQDIPGILDPQDILVTLE
jgi:hypothetical protein